MMPLLPRRVLAISRRNNVALLSRWTVTRASLSTASNNDNPSNTSNATSSSSSSSIEDQKRKLARAALKQVPQHGWTQDAITAAVVEEKMNIAMSGLLTPAELVNRLMDDFNQQLQGTTVFEKIQWRLRQVIPLVESGQWQNGMAIGLLSTPMTTRDQLHEFIERVAPLGSTTLYKTGLGGIFVATELHMLSDKSKDYQDTWTFLEQRLDELERGDLNLGGNIPLAATGAVASSLLEGVASLLLPPSSTSVAGTRTSDYSPQK
jgi:ubiquinone biosynthesis protein COQ9